MENEQPQEQGSDQELDVQYYFEPASSPMEDISAAYTAIMAADTVDTGMLEDMDEYEEKVRQIRMAALDIIYLRLLYIKDGITEHEPTEPE